MPSEKAPGAATNALPPGEASVDLFALTVSKPTPSEAKAVSWNAPPSPAFYASGYTLVKLMLSIQQGTIISVPADGVVVTRFADDKGANLDTRLYSESANRDRPFESQHLQRSPDGRQALVSFTIASAPTPGASRCTIDGTVQARVARAEASATSDPIELRKGQILTAGPFQGTIEGVRQTASDTPGAAAPEFEAWLNLAGPLGTLKSLEIVQPDGSLLTVSSSQLSLAGSNEPTSIRHALRFSRAPAGPVTVRLRYYQSEQWISFPFQLNTGIGL